MGIFRVPPECPEWHPVLCVTSLDHELVDLLPNSYSWGSMPFGGKKCYLIPFHPENGILEVVDVFNWCRKVAWGTNSILTHPTPCQINYHPFKEGRGSQLYFKTILSSRLPTCRIIGVTNGSQNTGNAIPVVEEKPGRDSKNSVSRAPYGRRPSRKCLS